MGNCLVTKLKGTVDNPNLLKLGYGVIHVTEVVDQGQWSAYGNYVSFGSLIEDVIVDIIGDGTLYDVQHVDLGKHAVVPAGSHATYWISNGTYDITYSGKYTLDYLEIMTPGAYIDMNEIRYSTQLTKIYDAASFEGVFPPNMSNVFTFLKYQTSNAKKIASEIEMQNMISWRSLQVWETDGIQVKGNLNALTIENFPNLTTFVAGKWDGSALVGRIDDVTANLTRFMPNGDSNITGTIEGFVAKQRVHRPVYTYDYGADTNLRFVNSSITFQGEPIPSRNVHLSWTENTITFEGVTINA